MPSLHFVQFPQKRGVTSLDFFSSCSGSSSGRVRPPDLMPAEEGEIPPQPLLVERAVEAAEGEEGLSNAKDGYTVYTCM